jgi:hypothetical protein
MKQTMTSTVTLGKQRQLASEPGETTKDLQMSFHTTT